jgi:hypothetical protein
MHVVVDHARQQPQAGGVEHLFTRVNRQVTADLGDALATDAQIGLPAPAFIDELRVAQQPAGHAWFLQVGGVAGAAPGPTVYSGRSP